MGFSKTDDVVFKIILPKKQPSVNIFRQRSNKNAFPEREGVKSLFMRDGFL